MLDRCVVAVTDFHFLNLQKDQDQYFANLSMKFNAKLGGVNHIVTGRTMDKLKERGTMFVGADVTHPSFLSLPGTPSIAGVVASSGKSENRNMYCSVVLMNEQTIRLRGTLSAFVCKRPRKK